jgi:hypothetical protein
MIVRGRSRAAVLAKLLTRRKLGSFGALTAIFWLKNAEIVFYWQQK